MLICTSILLGTQRYIFNHLSNAIVLFFFFYMLERNLEQYARIPPSSCEYFPTESCYSLKACTSRLVLAANLVRSHFEGKVSTFVLLQCFLHTSSPFQRMKKQFSFKQNSSKLSAQWGNDAMPATGVQHRSNLIVLSRQEQFHENFV